MVLPRLRQLHPLPGMVRRVTASYEEEFAFPRPERLAVADVAVTLQPGFWLVAYTALTSGRTVTLPPTASLDPGTMVWIIDEAGAAGSHTITVSAAGADVLNGTATISANFGVLRLVTNGAGGWFPA